MSDQTTRENLLRRELDHMGFRLVRSPACDPAAPTYQIINIDTGCIDAGRGFALSLADAEAWIVRMTRPRRSR